jgi:hypothetical protein
MLRTLPCLSRTARLVLVGLVVAGGGVSTAGGGSRGAPPASPAPPPEVKKVNDEIQQRFRAVRGLSAADLEKAAVEIRALITRLRELDPANAKATEYEKRLEKAIADARAGELREAKRAFDLRTGKIRMYLERNDEAERPQLREQRDLLARAIEENRAALEAAGDEGRALLSGAEAALKEADAAIGGALAGDALVNAWVGRLSAFARNGAKDLTTPIRGPAAYAQVQAWRKEAQQASEEYGKVDFPGGKTKDLERAEEFFRQSMAEADANLEEAVASRRKAATEKLGHVTDHFAGDTAWRQDPKTPPKRFADEMIEEARAAVDDLAQYVPGDPGVARLREGVEAVTRENTERRKAGAALTFLRREAYQGGDAEALRAAAKQRVPVDHEGAEALRVTIFTPSWKEETVTEWTDTTRSALRVRTTRTLMFTVAFRTKDGVFRDVGYLDQDRTADGSWGPTYAPLAKFRAPMPEANVEKDEP